MAVAFGAITAADGVGVGASFSHTPTAGAYVLVECVFDRASGTITATCGGVSMTLLASDTTNRSYIFGLANVAGGSQTIAITATNAWYSARATSYTGVGSVVVTKFTGSSTAPSTGPATCPTDGMVMGVITHGGIFTGVTMSAPTGGTNRAMVNTNNGAAALSVSDATTTTAFGATFTPAQGWAAYSVELHPAADDVPSGAASGSYTWAGAAAGSRASQGSASGSYTWASEATGIRASRGAASGSYAWAGAAVGNAAADEVPSGAASGSYAWAGAASGRRASRGSASGAYSWRGRASSPIAINPPDSRIYTPDPDSRIYTPGSDSRIYTPDELA